MNGPHVISACHKGCKPKQVDAIREQGRLRASENNRDILIEAAKWEIENIRFIVVRAWP